MTIDLKKKYFIYSFLLVVDLVADATGFDNKYATEWDLFVGNSPNWWENTKCTPTPRLAADFKDRVKGWGSDEDEELPDFGFVEWCNISG